MFENKELRYDRVRHPLYSVQNSFLPNVESPVQEIIDFPAVDSDFLVQVTDNRIQTKPAILNLALQKF